MSEAAHRARLNRPRAVPPTLAVAGGGVDVAVLRAAGWSLRGVLSPLPYDDPLGAATYTSTAALLDDPRLDGVALDGADPDVAGLLPALRADGLLLLLPTPAPLEVSLLQEAVAADGGPAVVGLLRRWEPWARTVAAAQPMAGPPVQVTVSGWPRGVAHAADLVDLVSAWCGEVVAAVAAPAVLPAAALAGGEPVSWALLTSSGATVLVAHEGDQVVRLSFAAARLEARPGLLVRWVDGDRLPVPSWPDALTAHPLEQRAALAAAATLAAAVGGADLPDQPQVLLQTLPGQVADAWPAGLGDLLACARVLEALRHSARREVLVPVA